MKYKYNINTHTTIHITITITIKEMICFRGRGQIQESRPTAPWTGNCYFYKEKYQGNDMFQEA